MQDCLKTARETFGRLLTEREMAALPEDLQKRLLGLAALLEGCETQDQCWQEARPWLECGHPKRETGYITCSNGTRQVKSQCVTCGHRSNAMRMADIPPDVRRPLAELPDYEADTPWNRYQKMVQQAIANRRDAIYREAARHESEEYAEWLSDSPVWAKVRRRVLERDDYVCQGCLEAKATQVHHLDYRDKYNPFAFQLVSLCRACHARYYGKEDE